MTISTSAAASIACCPRLSCTLGPELNYGAPTAPAEGLILMDVGYQGLEWQVDEYSRARAAKGAATVQNRMAGANVAREMERAMGLDAGD